MRHSTLRLVLTAVFAVACSFGMAQFNGSNWATNNVTTPPIALGATGWPTGTGQFPTGVPWQWMGTFSWTVSGTVSGVTLPAAPVSSGTTGTTTINFSNLATGLLPSGSWMYFGDIDESTGEWIDVQALDVNGAPIATPWLQLPQHFWPNPAASRPNATWSAATGSYRFSGYNGSTNFLNTLAFQTNAGIRTLRVIKNHVNNGFGLGAPKEPPFQGIEEFVRSCCEGKNFVENSTFKLGNVSFGSQFGFVASGPLAPGQYGIFNGASVVSRLTPPALPLVVDEVTNVMNSGSFLVARITNTPTVIWRQNVNVPKGELVACVRLKPFYNNPGWPPVVVSFKFSDNNATHTHTKSWWPLPAPGTGGWHDFTGTFHRWGSSPVSMEIIAHSPVASANHPIYLGLDNVALKPKVLVPNPNLFAITPAIANLNIGAGTYTVTITNWPNPTQLGYYWSIKDLSNSTLPEVQNPPQWWFPVIPLFGFNFPGFNGNTMTVGTATTFNTPPGVFLTNRNYRITYGLWGTCQKWQTVSWEIGYFGPAKKDGPPEIRRVRDDANATPPKGFNPDAIFEKLRPNKPPEGRSMPPTGDRGGQKTGGGAPKQGK